MMLCGSWKLIEIICDDHHDNFKCYGLAVDAYTKEQKNLIVVYRKFNTYDLVLLPQCGQPRGAWRLTVLAKYDEKAHAFYLKLDTESKRVAETIPLGDDKFADIDEGGNIMGFEILITAKQMPPQFDQIIRRTKAIEIS